MSDRAACVPAFSLPSSIAISLVLAGAFLSSSRTEASEFALDSFRSASSGGALRDFELADFDGDGALDLAAANEESGLAILPGDGRGGFGDRAQFVTGGSIRGLAVLDFDEDGDLDVVVTNAGTSKIRKLTSDGSGGFALSAPVTLEGIPVRARAADLDGDGHADLLTGNVRTHSLSVVLGDGAGGLAVLGHFPSGGDGRDPLAVAVADFDEDGVLDAVATGYEPGAVFFHRGLGDGLFEPFVAFPVESSAIDLAVADFDGDGHADVAAACELVERVSILPGDGSGGFALPATLVALRLEPRCLAAADFDEDGTIDIAIGADSAPLAPEGRLFVVRGDGFGGFGAPEETDCLLNDPERLAAADLDGDGHLDLVFANPSVDVAVALGDGAGGFGEPPAAFDLGGFAPRDSVAADFDRDGDLDIALAGDMAGTSGFLLLVSDGAGGLSISSFVAPVPPGVVRIASADFDSDGAADVAVLNSGRFPDDFGSVTIWLGDGSGGFTFSDSLNGGNLPFALAVSDFDEDGILDIAIGKKGGQNTAFLYRGDGAGLFEVVTTANLSVVVDLVAADFDGDGHADLANASGHSVSVVLGDGAFGFGPRTGYFPGDGTSSIAAADLDRDGALDLVVSVASNSSLAVLRGDGLGRLEPRRDFLVETGSQTLAAGDFYGDGYKDVAIGSSTPPSSVRLLRNVTPLALPDVLRGNVDANGGPITNVLFVNGRKGDGPKRRLVVDRDALFQIRMKAPPSLGDGPAAFALFAVVGQANESSITPLAGGYGPLAFPLSRVRKRWNDTGDIAAFGAPNFPSTPAPSLVLRRDRGLKKRIEVTLQGVIEDPESPSGVYGVTNGLTIDSR